MIRPQDDASSRKMETLSQAVERLAGLGYSRSFRANGDGTLSVGDTVFEPEGLVVDEVVRFEGASDPADASILFALSTSNGAIRGTFSAAYGPSADARSASVIHRLRDEGDRGDGAV
ncbi:MAG: hypothetical protein R3F21_22200 [Myxococcota bacterium]